MKNLLVIFSSLLVIAACSNVDQFRAPIEALTSDWEKATTSVTEVGSMIGAAQSSLMSLKDSLVVDPSKKMSAEATASMDSLKNAFTSQVDGLSGLASEVTTFATSWEEMSGKLAALKDGLAAGKLEGDVMAQLDELKNAAMDAGTKVEAWTTKLNESKAAAMAAYEMFTQKAMSK